MQPGPKIDLLALQSVKLALQDACAVVGQGLEVQEGG